MKNTTKTNIAIALICLAATVTTSAKAATVQIREIDLAQGLASNGLVLPVQASVANYWAGLQTILVDNTKRLLAFCVDPWEWSPSSDRPYVESGNIVSYFGSTKAERVRELYADAYALTLLPASAGGNSSAAAFQLALWEIIADNDLDLASGAVRTVASTNPQLAGDAKVLIDHLGDGRYNNESYTFEFYSSGKSMGRAMGSAIGNTAANGFQDYLVVHRIPEPSTGALLLAALGAAGIGCFGFGATTRRKQPGTSITPG